ncbi:hypothetical protein E8E12_007169 [Didymella heteroderae]|uniref:Rhodopsin domain-containing protein n=1 Tax=Didymella heteroderae TaxID=1769908 RepID=A0A9P4WPF6_9PLEO|nr:hypothetical protein E8E12_007169 [Didymella heteroderae]
MFAILAVVAVGLRLLAHAIAHKRWTYSDYLIIAACVFAVGLQSVSITGVFEAGIGYDHVEDIILEHGLGPITKLSQLIIPLQFLWVTSFTVTGVINLITDVAVLLLPMQPLYQLQMATYKKVVLVSVFGLGIFTCIISALRISVLSSMDFADITFTIPKANIFSGIEPCLAVVLASVPMMRPLLGQSAATPSGSSQRPVKADSRTKGSRRVSDNGFLRLDDDAGNLPLRPMGLQYRADISALRETRNEDASNDDREAVRAHNDGGRNSRTN